MPAALAKAPGLQQSWRGEKGSLSPQFFSRKEKESQLLLQGRDPASTRARGAGPSLRWAAITRPWLEQTRPPATHLIVLIEKSLLSLLKAKLLWLAAREVTLSAPALGTVQAFLSEPRGFWPCFLGY